MENLKLTLQIIIHSQIKKFRLLKNFLWKMKFLKIIPVLIINAFKIQMNNKTRDCKMNLSFRI